MGQGDGVCELCMISRSCRVSVQRRRFHDDFASPSEESKAYGRRRRNAVSRCIFQSAISCPSLSNPPSTTCLPFLSFNSHLVQRATGRASDVNEYYRKSIIHSRKSRVALGNYLTGLGNSMSLSEIPERSRKSLA